MSARDQANDTDNGKIKDPADWATGGEPMTGAQESYAHTLARQAGEEEALPDEMTKSEASEKIDELRDKAGLKSKAKAPAATKNKAASKLAKG